MLSDNRRPSRREVYSIRQKKLSMPLEINAVYINSGVVQKQRSREGVKQSPHFQRVNGLVQFQPIIVASHSQEAEASFTGDQLYYTDQAYYALRTYYPTSYE